jgi:hypothetical protein
MVVSTIHTRKWDDSIASHTINEPIHINALVGVEAIDILGPEARVTDAGSGKELLDDAAVIVIF